MLALLSKLMIAILFAYFQILLLNLRSLLQLVLLKTDTAQGYQIQILLVIFECDSHLLF